MDECKGLKREDLERLSRKAKEREDRHKDGPQSMNADADGHREPLLELPPMKDRDDGSGDDGSIGPIGTPVFPGGDVDLRIPPGAGGVVVAGDMDYRVPGPERERLQIADHEERMDSSESKRTPPRGGFYRDTIESPREDLRKSSFDGSRSPTSSRRRSSESSDSKRLV